MNVVKLPVENFRSVDRVIDAARDAGLTDIIIVGWDRNGELWTDVNIVDGGDILWLLEMVKKRALEDK